MTLTLSLISTHLPNMEASTLKCIIKAFRQIHELEPKYEAAGTHTELEQKLGM